MFTDLKLDPLKLGQEAQFVGESKAMTKAGLDIGSLISGIVEESSDQA